MNEPQSHPQETRPSLFTSVSSAGSALARVSLKRPITTDFDFLSTAAESFHPKPYSPARAGSSTSVNNPRMRYGQRTASRPNVAAPHLTLDVTEKDPDAILVHPPFTDFPDAAAHPEGLTFALMADHLDWFLDPKDFIPLEGGQSSPNAIPYPPFLEPPRGWCPAKKKEIKEKGSDCWAEGEEPKLRCTFCRRAYAGVNAKSMWRRHVFEKHKVAMSNRREGSDKPRGRGSMKENRRPGRGNDEHDSVLRIEIAPQSVDFNATHRSRFQGIANPRSRSNGSASDGPERSSQQESSFASDDSTPPPSTPPPMDWEPSLAISSSPYDPTLTPAFIHSSPKLPSAQPWRFPSPTHPLHSRSRQLSLSMLVTQVPSPSTKSFLAADSPDRGQLANNVARSSPSKSVLLPSTSPVTSAASSPRYLGRRKPQRDHSDSFTPTSTINDTPGHWAASVLHTPGKNPFTLMYEDCSTPLKGDSPILRSTKTRSPPVQLGAASLLEPINLDSDFALKKLSRDDDDEAGVVISLVSPSASHFFSDFVTPPPKRRRVDTFAS